VTRADTAVAGWLSWWFARWRFVIVRRVLGLVGLGPAPDAKDIEIAVLRHQLMVVRRQRGTAVAHCRYGVIS